MPILKYRCPSADICNSTECQHKDKKGHEKNEFCHSGCKHSKNSLCQSDLKGYIDNTFCDVVSCVTPVKDAVDAIMAAIREEYDK
jgi:hypothetical protein